MQRWIPLLPKNSAASGHWSTQYAQPMQRSGLLRIFRLAAAEPQCLPGQLCLWGIGCAIV
jgi:hypothetical protein